MTPEYDLYAKFHKINISQYVFLDFVITLSKVGNTDGTFHGKYYKLLISNVIFKSIVNPSMRVKYTFVPKNLMKSLCQGIDESALDKLLIDFEISDIKINTRDKLYNLCPPGYCIAQVFYCSKIE